MNQIFQFVRHYIEPLLLQKDYQNKINSKIYFPIHSLFFVSNFPLYLLLSLLIDLLIDVD